MRCRQIAPHERANTSQQFSKREGLYQVVVRSRVQTDYAIFDGIPRGEDQNRNVQAGSSHIAQYFQTTAGGEHQVEQNEVEVKTAYGRERVFTIRRKGNFVTLPVQAFRYSIRQLPFILNQQNIQACSCPA